MHDPALRDAVLSALQDEVGHLADTVAKKARDRDRDAAKRGGEACASAVREVDFYRFRLERMQTLIESVQALTK